MNLKYCPKCNKVISLGRSYCDICEKKINSISARNYKDRMDKEDIKRDKFYKSKEWVKLREYILVKYNYIDVYDYIVNNKITRATTVHHIIEIREDWSKRLDVNNLFPVSKENHKRIHEMYKSDKEGTMILLRKILKSWEKKIKG